MNILSDVSLSRYSTMGLGGNAKFLVEVATRMDILEALSWAQNQNLPAIMIGGGSNIVWQDSGFPGIVLVNRLKRYEEFNEDETNIYVTAGSGEIWDEVVARTVQAGLTGIEALSLIPGTVGAVPVQNVGAYGQEISQTLVTVEAFDTEVRDFVNLAASDCGFGYRTSRFKTTDRGRFFISAITLHLTRGNCQPPFYPAVANYLRDNSITDTSPTSIRNVVIAIRRGKLPDPAWIKNCGSFFANPIIDTNQVIELEQDMQTTIPYWAAGEGKSKVAAAWLIEQAGFKDFHDPETGMATWPTQPLVFVNENAHSTEQLLSFRQKVIDAVKTKFNISLEQEPEILP